MSLALLDSFFAILFFATCIPWVTVIKCLLGVAIGAILYGWCIDRFERKFHPERHKRFHARLEQERECRLRIDAAMKSNEIDPFLKYFFMDVAKLSVADAVNWEDMAKRLKQEGIREFNQIVALSAGDLKALGMACLGDGAQLIVEAARLETLRKIEDTSGKLKAQSDMLRMNKQKREQKEKAE